VTPQTSELTDMPGTKEEGKKHLQAVALRTYSGNKRESAENERITELLPMIHKIAQRVTGYLKPPLSYEDLISAGTIGLVKAVRDFNPACQADIKTYAYIRIKGAILDEMRGWSFISANLTRKVRKIAQISRKMTEQTGKPPTDEELAEKLGITLDELYKTFDNARSLNFISIDASGDETSGWRDVLASANTTTPEKQLENNELIDRLAEAIQQLPEKQRQTILLYYRQNLTMKQVAEVLGITESRISQIHSGALFNLSVKLRLWKDGR